MLVRDDGTRNSQALAGSSTHFFRGEKRIENFVLCVLGNTGSGIGDADLGPCSIMTSRDCYTAF